MTGAHFMNARPFLVLASAFAISAAPLSFAEPTRDSPAPLISKAGALLFAEEFNERKPSWTSGHGDWKIEDGTIRGAETKEQKHKAALAQNVKFRDCVIRLVFKFDGARAIDVSFVKPSRETQREHVCRLSMSLDSLKLYAQTGMAKTTKNILIAEKPLRLVGGRTYVVLIEAVGSEFVAQLDTGDVVRGSHELLAVEKTSLNLGISGSSGVIDDLKLWSAAAKQ